MIDRHVRPPGFVLKSGMGAAQPQPSRAAAASPRSILPMASPAQASSAAPAPQAHASTEDKEWAAFVSESAAASADDGWDAFQGGDMAPPIIAASTDRGAMVTPRRPQPLPTPLPLQVCLPILVLTAAGSQTLYLCCAGCMQDIGTESEGCV